MVGRREEWIGRVQGREKRGMDRTGSWQGEEGDRQDGFMVGRRGGWIGRVQGREKRGLDRTGSRQGEDRDGQDGFMVGRREDVSEGFRVRGEGWTGQVQFKAKRRMDRMGTDQRKEKEGQDEEKKRMLWKCLGQGEEKDGQDGFRVGRGEGQIGRVQGKERRRMDNWTRWVQGREKRRIGLPYLWWGIQCAKFTLPSPQ